MDNMTGTKTYLNSKIVPLFISSNSIQYNVINERKRAKLRFQDKRGICEIQRYPLKSSLYNNKTPLIEADKLL